ncbi:MAG TPA: CD225/dispanin family protein [Actinomycetota bacterium]|nr:CD225/dispanin family protein [Actinomycetota bacterium]
MSEPVFRNGAWWQQQGDGTWLRWNDGAQTWERSETPPPPDESGLPPAPPPPGQGTATSYPVTPVANVRIPTYLVWAILVTLLCFLPTGIVAIVFASQVTSKLQAGDVAGATEASNKAKMWTIISAVAGVVLAIALVAASVGTSGSPSFT